MYRLDVQSVQIFILSTAGEVAVAEVKRSTRFCVIVGVEALSTIGHACVETNQFVSW